jgi:PTS system mannose-specific IIC component
MESYTPYLLGAGMAVLLGLDRTAALQIMISRPLVAGPLVGLLLGDIRTGLTVGMLLELLWLCRMPVGASIPHDDTQITVGATTLAIALSGTLGGGIGLTLGALLVALPLGKIGQRVERTVRTLNQRLPASALACLQHGQLPAVERLQLCGLGNFALGALTTYTAIVLIGRWLMISGAPFFLTLLTRQADWIKLALILAGVATLLQALNVRRTYGLFFGGFLLTFLLLGVLR